MTDKQPEALRIADAFGIPHWTGLPIALHVEAAAELRRLHEVNAELVEACRMIVKAFDELSPTAMNEPLQIHAARAAIAKATGDKP